MSEVIISQAVYETGKRGGVKRVWKEFTRVQADCLAHADSQFEEMYPDQYKTYGHFRREFQVRWASE